MRALVASIVAAAIATAAPARADDAEAAALAHLGRGVEAFHAGDYVTARAELTRAHELAPDRANPYRWLALTAMQQGDCAAVEVNASGFLARVRPDDPRAAELIRLRALCRAEASRAPAAAPAPAASSSPPVYRRWWFWTAVAGAAAVTATAIVLTAGDDPSVLPPIACGATGCAP